MNKIEKLFSSFIETQSFETGKDNGYKSAINTIRKTLPDMNPTPSWADIYAEMVKTEHRKNASQVMIIWLLFSVCLDKNGLLSGKNKGLFAKNADAIEDYATSTFVGKVAVIRDENFNPLSVVKPERKTPPKPQEKNRIFVIKSLTEQEFDFIMLYLSSIDDNWRESRLRKGLIDAICALSAGHLLPTNINEYNDSLFEQQFDLIQKLIPNEKKNKHDRQTMAASCTSELINFYIWIQNALDEKARNDNFKVYTLSVLKYQYLVSCLCSGYTVVNYSIYDNPPRSDKWILNPQKMMLHETAEADKITSLDLTIIKNKYLRQWVKECYWFDDTHGINNRTKEYRPIFDFIAIIDEKCENDQQPKIEVDDVLSYKALCMSRNTQDSTVSRKLGFVRYFLNFIKNKGYFDVDELLFRLLIHHDSDSNPYKETYTKEEIKQLLDAYRDSYEKCEDEDRSLLYALYYYVIAIQSISEMRISTILNLKTDCLVKTLDRKQNSEYKVVVQSKTSGKDFEEYNITKYVKSLIDEVKALTSDVRASASGVEKEYLFIYRRRSHRIVGIVRQDALSVFHKNVCNEYGIRQLQLGAIRNYYQQQVSNYVVENNGDPMMIERLSKHGINVHIQHYDTVDIKDFCQRFYQVEIGSIEIKGRVEEKNDKPKRNDVAHGCGHCSLEKCVLTGNLECLMCDKFVTTLDCIPFFEKEIASIDKMILKQPLQHEKEFLNNKKRLNVAYLTKLYELEANINGSKSV